MALFLARNVWFVVSVPIFLASVLGWSATGIGGLIALSQMLLAKLFRRASLI